VLPVETYIHYTRALHLSPPASETHKLGPLPQNYASEFGWPEMVATVARVYNSLPPDVRAKTAIFVQNFGQAGAIDLFGPKYGLPRAISGHQSYFFWGPGGYTGESMIVMDDSQERLEQLFASVEKVRERVPPILDAVRACRRVLLPRAQAAVEGIVAAGEALELKTPHN